MQNKPNQAPCRTRTNMHETAANIGAATNQNANKQKSAHAQQACTEAACSAVPPPQRPTQPPKDVVRRASQAGAGAVRVVQAGAALVGFTKRPFLCCCQTTSSGLRGMYQHPHNLNVTCERSSLCTTSTHVSCQSSSTATTATLPGTQGRCKEGRQAGAAAVRIAPDRGCPGGLYHTALHMLLTNKPMRLAGMRKTHTLSTLRSSKQVKSRHAVTRIHLPSD
jgi:hypothetical protein